MARKQNVVVEQDVVVDAVVVEQAAQPDAVEESTFDALCRKAGEAKDYVVDKATSFYDWMKSLITDTNWAFAGAIAAVSALLAFAAAGIAALLGVSAVTGLAVGAGVTALFGIYNRHELAQASELAAMFKQQ